MDKFTDAIATITLKLQRAEFWIEFGTITKYDRLMKPEFDKVCAEIISTYPDFRAHHVKTAKKADLAAAIVVVGERTKEFLLREIELTQAKIREHEKSLELKKQQEARDLFWVQVSKQQKDYFDLFDSPKQAMREWECLNGLVLDGTITRENISEYGITLG